MNPIKMHDNEVETSVDLVKKLLIEQFPQWSTLSVSQVSSSGTANAIFRLGDDRVVRLPRIPSAEKQIHKEHRWLPLFEQQLPFHVPVPLAKGKPTEDYPFHWSVYEWLLGENVTIDSIPQPNQTARDIADFMMALQCIDTANGPLASEHGLRGVPLVTRDQYVRDAIVAMEGLIDTTLVTKVWEESLEIPEWTGEPVWFHGDLLSGNLLFHNKRLHAIIDYGSLGLGDPACDMMVGWSLFSRESRVVLRETLSVDDATWARGRGHALAQALIYIPYYLNTNPVGVRNAFRQLKEVLADYRED